MIIIVAVIVIVLLLIIIAFCPTVHAVTGGNLFLYFFILFIPRLSGHFDHSRRLFNWYTV